PGEMQRHRRCAGRHVDLVRERIAVDPIPALEAPDVQARRRAADRELFASETELVFLEAAVCDLRDPDGVGEHELDVTGRRARPYESALEVERLILRAPALLDVREPGVSDVIEPERLAVRERLDRRVAAGPFAAPRPEQESKPSNVGMQLGRHAATVPRTRGTTCGYGVAGSPLASSSSPVVRRSS